MTDGGMRTVLPLSLPLALMPADLLRYRRNSAYWLALLVVALTAGGVLLYRNPPTYIAPAQLHDLGTSGFFGSTAPRDCRSELAVLKEYLDLPPSFEYARRLVRAKPVKKLPTYSVVDRAEELVPGFEHVDLDNDECVLREDASSIVVEYEDFAPAAAVDTSALMIGASTTLSRLRKALPQMARWLGNSSTPIVFNIDDMSDRQELDNVRSLVRSYAIDATLVRNADTTALEIDQDDRHAQRHFAITKILRENRRPETRFFAVIDDDTFFPSLPALVQELSAFDPDKSLYIGQLSEDWLAVIKWGHMAFGGAGVFITAPLLETLYENFDACQIAGLEGDKLYRDCIYRMTSPHVELTRLEGLHQMDMIGDPSGWYESGLKRPILSLHHFRGWHSFPVESAHLVFDICGQSCFLQRYHFSDDVILTNGYSIAQYPQGLGDLDLMRVEATFLHEKGQFDFSLGGLRPKLSEKEKLSWRLEVAIKDERGMVRQFYVKRKGFAEREKARKQLPIVSVFELTWHR